MQIDRKIKARKIAREREERNMFIKSHKGESFERSCEKSWINAVRHRCL